MSVTGLPLRLNESSQIRTFESCAKRANVLAIRVKLEQSAIRPPSSSPPLSPHRETSDAVQPLSSAPRASKLFAKSGGLSGYLRLMRDLSHDFDWLETETGVSVDQITDQNGEFTLTQMLNILNSTAQRYGIDDIGLQMSRRHQLSDWGIYGYIILNSPSVLEILRNLAVFVPLLQQATNCNLIIGADTVTFQYRLKVADVQSRRHEAEAALGMVFGDISALSNYSVSPMLVQFEHPRPRNALRYDAFFGCRVEFGAESNRIVFRRADCDHHIESADVQLLGILKAHARSQLESHPAEGDLIGQLRVALQEHLSAKRSPNLPEIARHLHVSTRTLQRALQAQHLTFLDILAEVQCEYASRLLENTDMGVKEIAFLTGFRQCSSFSRAFRREMGQSPLEWRNVARTSASLPKPDPVH